MYPEGEGMTVGVYDFGLMLKELRSKSNLTQKQVGDRLGIDKNTISAYERNVQTPKSDVVVSLALLFNVSTDHLLGLNCKTAIYIDGLTESQQEVLYRMKEELEKSNNTGCSN